MAVILDFGTEEQKRRHIPPILRGEELWMQFLSEPSGGSDVAGAQTTAVRDGDEWVMNGSKIWTTGAWWADWGLCLARTNWDVPKHRGLSVFMLKIHQPGIEVHRIEMLNGSTEFCQEFITDVRIPDGDRIGEVDQGWTVGTRWMYHERTLSGGSPYVRPGRPAAASVRPRAAPTATCSWPGEFGRLEDSRVRELIGEAYTGGVVGEALDGVGLQPDPDRARSPIRRPASSASIRRDNGGAERRRSVSRSPGNAAVAWPEDDEDQIGIVLHHPPAGLHRWRDHRDEPQRDQRAGARDAPGADPRQGRPLPRRPEERPEPLSRSLGPDRLWDPTSVSGGVRGSRARVVVSTAAITRLRPTSRTSTGKAARPAPLSQRFCGGPERPLTSRREIVDCEGVDDMVGPRQGAVRGSLGQDCDEPALELWVALPGPVAARGAPPPPAQA